MSDEGFKINWQGRKLIARPMTDKMKEKYGVWAYNQMLRNARQRMDWNQYMAYENRLTAKPPEWTSIPDPSILSLLDTPAGGHQYIRIVMDLSEDVADDNYMSDDELKEMLAEKTDPNCDLMRAMKQIGALNDPKAPKGGPGSPRPEEGKEPTPPSAGETSDSQLKQSAA